MNIENISTEDLLAEVARRIDGNEPESTSVNWPVINGYTIEPVANLRGADLRRADLFGANLRRADLRGADLRRADLFEADLFGADLRGAWVNEDTEITLPEGWKIEDGRIMAALEGEK